PEDTLLHGDSVVAAHLARAVAAARLGAAFAELLPKAQEAPLLEVLRALSEGSFHYPLAKVLLSSVAPAAATGLGELASATLAKGPLDLATWRSATLRLADRFALVASGSLPAALDASALPDVYRGAPDEVAERLQTSARALDLCRFAA